MQALLPALTSGCSSTRLFVCVLMGCVCVFPRLSIFILGMCSLVSQNVCVLEGVCVFAEMRLFALGVVGGLCWGLGAEPEATRSEVMGGAGSLEGLLLCAGRDREERQTGKRQERQIGRAHV